MVQWHSQYAGDLLGHILLPTLSTGGKRVFTKPKVAIKPIKTEIRATHAAETASSCSISMLVDAAQTSDEARVCAVLRGTYRTYVRATHVPARPVTRPGSLT